MGSIIPPGLNPTVHRSLDMFRAAPIGLFLRMVHSFSRRGQCIKTFKMRYDSLGTGRAWLSILLSVSEALRMIRESSMSVVNALSPFFFKLQMGLEIFPSGSISPKALASGSYNSAEGIAHAVAAVKNLNWTGLSMDNEDYPGTFRGILMSIYTSRPLICPPAPISRQCTLGPQSTRGLYHVCGTPLQSAC